MRRRSESGYRRRLVWAVLAALVLHTVVALVAPRRPADTAETATIAERMTT
ncbi:MAG: hypothetical protein IAI48_18930, partial [Candidatus Eremiobacteraeota bacterium]|nr:hypothetical protein [Candidatus Eremiobacteraeota bacterium]